MHKDKNHILRKAIDNLPIMEAPENLWREIENDLNRENDHILENVIDAYKKSGMQAPDLWDSLEQKLDKAENEQILKKAISELPRHKIEKELFNEIYSKSNGRSRWLYWAWGIAASLAIFALVLVQINKRDYSETVSLSYSEEISDWADLNISNSIDSDASNDEVFQFIQANCSELILKCEEPHFKGLLDQYIELGEAQAELQTQIEQNDTRVQLVKYLVRVEKERNEIGNQLIQYILNS